MLRKLLVLLSCTAFIISAVDPQVFTFKSIDGLDLKISVYYAPENLPSSGKYPVLFATHGGGYIAGSRDTALYPQQLEETLKRGWVTVMMDYRLQPVALIDEIFQDIQDAYKWVHTELPNIVPVDLDRIGVFGGSAGGGLALMNGFKLNPRPKVVISLYPYCANWNDPAIYKPETPISDALAALAESVTDNKLEHSFVTLSDSRYKLWMNALKANKIGWLMATHDPQEPTDKIVAKLKEFSATENVDESYPPTYLAHGTKDFIVNYNQSVQMADKLKEKGIPFVLDLVPNVGHTFDAHNSVQLWEEHVLPAFEFASKYLNAAGNEVVADKTFLTQI